MFSFMRRSTTHVLGVAAIAAFAAGLLLATQAEGLAAQRRAPAPVPAGERWCGLADSGGTVRFELTPDKRFVQWIEIATERGLLTTNEDRYDMTKQPIMDAQFIFRRDNRETQCTPSRSPGRPDPCLVAPCRPEPECPREPCERTCRTVETNQLTIRGKFLASDHVRGTYTGLIEHFLYPDRREGTPSRTYRVVGSYIAWPADLAPCP
jgi:hypothetical protein